MSNKPNNKSSNSRCESPPFDSIMIKKTDTNSTIYRSLEYLINKKCEKTEKQKLRGQRSESSIISCCNYERTESDSTSIEPFKSNLQYYASDSLDSRDSVYFTHDYKSSRLVFVHKLMDEFITDKSSVILLNLSCQLSDVADSIQWFKECKLLVTIVPNEAYNQENNNIIANFDPSNFECTLSIHNNAHSFDFAGKYSCVAKNSQGSTRCSCNVFVDCYASDGYSSDQSNEELISSKHETSVEKFEEEDEDEFININLSDNGKNSTPEEFKKHFNLEDEIGKGKFGVVHRCLHNNSNQRFAAKFIKIRPSNKKLIKQELEIMKCLKHKRLIGLINAYESITEIIIVMQLVTGGELFLKLTEEDYISEKDVIFYMRQILEGVDYMHDNSIVHLDLKPENIMLVRPGSRFIKLIDFGLATRINTKEDCKVLAGTPEFVAPEVINFDKISLETDMWSIGVITYLLLTGVSPFAGDSPQDTLTNVTRAKWSFDDVPDVASKISDWAKDFVSKLIIKDPKKRISAKNSLNHQWFKMETLCEPNIATNRLKMYTIHRKYQRQISNVRSSNFITLIINGVYNKPYIEDFTNNSSMVHLKCPSSSRTALDTESNPIIHGSFSSKSTNNLLSKSSSIIPTSISYQNLQRLPCDCHQNLQTHLQTNHQTQQQTCSQTRSQTHSQTQQHQPNCSCLNDQSPITHSLSFMSGLDHHDTFDHDHKRPSWKYSTFVDDANNSAPIIEGSISSEIICNLHSSITIPLKFKYPKLNELPKITWWIDGKNIEKCINFQEYAIKTDLNETNELNCPSTVSLSIETVEYYHTGKYTVRIENIHGALVRTVRLLVYGPPSAPSKPNWTFCYPSNTNTIEIFWRAQFNGNSPILGYTIQYKKQKELEDHSCLDHSCLDHSWVVFAQNVTDTRLEISDLDFDVYSFRVLAFNQYGCSAPSDYTLVFNHTPSVTDNYGQNSSSIGKKNSRRISMNQRSTSLDSYLYCSNPLFFYSIGDELSKGKYSAIFSTKSLNTKQQSGDYVMKIVKYDDTTLEYFKMEHKILSLIKHDNIVQFKESFLVRKYLIHILHRCPGVNLLNYMSIIGPNENKLSNVIRQLCNGLKYIHDQSIVHLDIKPTNLIVSPHTAHLTIVDFGSAQSLLYGESLPYHILDLFSKTNNSLTFAAPEIIAQDKIHLNTDMWSVGVVTFICLCGAYPFKNNSNQELQTFIISADYRFPYHSQYVISESAKCFIKKLLVVEPLKRMSSSDSLTHEWIINEKSRMSFNAAESKKSAIKKKLNHIRSCYSELQTKINDQETCEALKASFVLRSFEEPPFDSPINSSDDAYGDGDILI